MKIPEQKPSPQGAPAPPSAQEKGTKGAKGAKQKAFSEKLHKKGQDPKGAPLLKGPPSEKLLNLPVLPQAMVQTDAAPVSQTASVAPALPIEALVREIQVHVEPSGASEVQIEFNSRTLDGLKVNIRKDETGAVAITFVASNERTSELLAKNIPALSQALADKGVPVSAIQLTGEARPTQRFTTGEPSSSGGNSGGDSGSGSGSGSGTPEGRQRKRR